MENTDSRILVIDDEEMVVNSLSRFLRSEGYTVETALCAEEGLASLERKPADVVITDIRMPDLSGLDLLCRIREALPRMDVILISGHGDMDDAIEALRRGAYDYLRKPIDLDELGIVLQRALKKQQADRENTRMREQLYHAQKMEALGTLAGGVAHEFNNLMSAILGYADMALEQDTPVLKEKALEVSRQGARRAAEIARNLLHFARREKSRAVPTQLNEIVEETLRLIHKDLERADVQVRQLLGSLPQVEVNQGQFQQVFLNLFVNARQAMEHVGGDKILTISSMCEDDEIVFDIRDTGPGIPDEIRHRVVDPFFSTHGVLQGGAEQAVTGLGLSVVDGIVRGHGGVLEIGNAPTGGARVVFRLPMAVQADSRARSVLLCDDEANVRRILRAVLEKAGFDVDEATGGAEALEAVARRRYDVLFLDQLMPGMNGLDVLRRLQEVVPELPVVMVTAMVNDQIAREAIEAGACECVFKPVNSHRLCHLAEKYAQGRSQLTVNSDLSSIEPSSKHILILDADPVVRDVLRLVLSRIGFRVHLASSAREALEITQRQYYDLILVDAIVHDMDLLKAVRGLRLNNPYTPISMLSPNARSMDVRRHLRAGVSHVMDKPINPGEILEEVVNLMRLHEVPRQRT